MRFIRKNGRVIPIGDKKEAKPKQKTVTIKKIQGYDMKFKTRDVSAGERAKNGAALGAGIGLLGAGVFAEIGAKALARHGGEIAGVAIGLTAAAAVGSGLSAAFGRKKQTDVIMRPRLSKGRKVRI